MEENNIIIDIDRLRSDLTDYFGSAVYDNPFAMADVVNIDNVPDISIVRIAIENGFDLNDYSIGNTRC